MATIAENLQILVDNKANIKEAIEDCNHYEISSNMSTWPEEIRNLKNKSFSGSHVDENGVWHKPDEWPDIESLSLPEEGDCVYFLYHNHITEGANISLVIYRENSRATVDLGHIENGEFVVDENKYASVTPSTSAFAVYVDLTLYAGDYTILRVQGDGFRYINTYAYGTAGTSEYRTRLENTCLMRYGTMKYGLQPYFNCYFVESDNIKDLGTARTTNTTVSWANLYLYCYNLQRWRHTNWDLSHIEITSLDNFMLECNNLSDIDPDLSGWITNSCTSLSGVFRDCNNLPYLDCSNWDTSDVRAVSYMFQNCYNLRLIKGIEDWDLSNNLTLYYTFTSCQSIKKLDLGQWNISNLCTNWAYTFNSCYKLEYLSIEGWDLSGATGMATAFSGLRSLTEINLNNIIPPTSTCTNFVLLFYYCSKLKSLTLNGWNFSGVSAHGNFNLLFSYGGNLEKLVLSNCTLPSTISSQNANLPFFRYTSNLKYLDLRGLDFSVFTTTGQTSFFTDLVMCIDLYPPSGLNLPINIRNAVNLSHDSIIRMFNALSNVTGTVKITMGTRNIGKVTAEEIAIATNKGWTVSAS